MKNISKIRLKRGGYIRPALRVSRQTSTAYRTAPPRTATAPAPLTKTRLTKPGKSTLSVKKLAKQVETSTQARPVQAALNKTATRTKTKATPLKSRLKPGRKAKTTEVTPVNFMLNVDAFGTGKKVDKIQEATTTMTAKKAGGVVTRLYTRHHHIRSPYSRWIKSMMKKYPATIVRMRDDDNSTPNNMQRRPYGTCGFNRRGLWYPPANGTSSPNTATKPFTSWVTTTSAPNSMAAYPMNRYEYNRVWYSPAFKGEDYDALYTLKAWIDYYNTSQVQDRQVVDMVFPLTKKTLTTVITNNNTYTPCKIKVYVIRNKVNAHIPAAAYCIDPNQSGVNVGIPLDYIYTASSPDVPLLDSGAASTNVTGFVTERSMHLEASPFMGQRFKDYFDLTASYTKILGPGDILKYKLSVDQDGLRLSDAKNNFSYNGNANMDQRYIIGDYQLVITYEGLPKYTALFKKVVVTNPGPPPTYGVEYPQQMAVSGVTNPCCIDVRSSLEFEVHESDFYQRKIEATARTSNFDGNVNYLNQSTSVVQLERRLAAGYDVVVENNRRFMPHFTVAYDDIVTDKTTASASTPNGFFLDVKTEYLTQTISPGNG